MAYQKTNWTEQTAITPERLNKIENGIEQAENSAEWLTVRDNAKATLNPDDPRMPLEWHNIGPSQNPDGTRTEGQGDATYFTRMESTQPLRVEVRSDRPANPEVGRVWLIV